MPTKETTVTGYLESLPDDRRKALEAVRAAIKKKLPAGYEEGILYGGISWFVPKARLATTYNGQPLVLATIVSQKSYMSLHLMSVYGDKQLHDDFVGAYEASGKKLDMGKGCIRFKKLDDLPLDVVANFVSKLTVDRYIETYQKMISSRQRAKK